MHLNVDSNGPMEAEVTSTDQDRLAVALKKYWGYDHFRPLQQQAMQCVLTGRDSVVVLPTGGGKSLCYQVPSVCLEGLTIVVSPLISLMKDQVDALTDCGVAAACIHSQISTDEKRRIAESIRSGNLQLLYCSPERIVQPRMLEFLNRIHVAQIAIDEAHCISSWGHDFRPEYRQLRRLKEVCSDAGVHAYTATATEQVRRDVATQLELEQPEMLVGSFDRPNLIYRVRRRHQRIEQIRAVIDRHPGASGIIYCISRKEVENTAAALTDAGYRARPYHAGMNDTDRVSYQEQFSRDEIDIIVATVAFGMGIDKSNVRYVIHSGMPKSLEQYQQESGRAGRDGLEAECWLFYSGNDYILWQKMIEKSDSTAQQGALRALQTMASFCQGANCRHQAIVRHFGQELQHDACGACDVCLEELTLISDALVTGQKILSCVVRVEQRYGADYTAKVLSGSTEQRIVASGHNRLSTWGLLSGESIRTIRDWTEQLVSQGYLEKIGDYHVLNLTESGRQLLRGEVTPRLLKPAQSSHKRRSQSGSQESHTLDDWENVDQELFEILRNLRRELASQRGVPAYIVFGDRALRDMARQQPTTLGTFCQVSGVGEKKLAEYGEIFVKCIQEHLDPSS
jgi:ATP-dependent DNA helicase RecQ